jgi:hypothetical protein
LKKAIDWSGYSLFIIGMVLILIAIASDLIHLGGEAGIGAKQKALLGVGTILALLGIIFWTKPGRNFLSVWVDPSLADCQSLPMDTFRQKALVTLVIAAWFGLVTGFLEILYRIFNRITANTIINLSQHFYWMAPLAYLVLFLMVGLSILAIGLILPKITNIAVIIFSFTFISVMCIYYTSPKLYLVAILSLALGLSLQLSRHLSKRSCLFFRSVNHSLPWMITGVLAVAAFSIGYLS